MILIPSTHPRPFSKNNRHKVMQNNLPLGAGRIRYAFVRRAGDAR